MSANIDKLRELAMGATGGAWRTESYYDMDGVRRTILIPFSLELPSGMEESDMAYIAAANPDAVLALLDEVEAAHQIIQHALAVMATEQKSELLNREDMQRLAVDGGTRYHERAALIAKAEGKSK